ncbi:MAG: hypothetical protein IJ131_06555 [Eggerthellaceae bacterium]|nr:hypothetical protein [Eggerthellaceae bacterium]
MVQFSVDDIVMYGPNGCCKVAAIEQRDAGMYYILHPVHNDHTKLLVPMDNEDLVGRMRHVPSKRVLRDCIKRALEEPLVWIDDSAERKEAAKHVLSFGSEVELLVLVRSFYKHKEAILASGKKATSSDNAILKTAQEHVRDEFSVVLGIDVDEVDDYIHRTVISI